jgi:hypothetical protein
MVYVNSVWKLFRLSEVTRYQVFSFAGKPSSLSQLLPGQPSALIMNPEQLSDTADFQVPFEIHSGSRVLPVFMKVIIYSSVLQRS